MKQSFDFNSLEALFVERKSPMWRPVNSREFSSIIGVSLQTLANWRVRNDGPKQEPPRKGQGNRTFYRPDKFLSWLSKGKHEPWEFSRKWLLHRDFDVVGGLDEDATNWYIGEIDEYV